MTDVRSNKTLRTLLRQLLDEVPTAKNEAELLALVRKARTYGPRLEFDHSMSNTIAVMLALAGGVQIGAMVFLLVSRGGELPHDPLSLALMAWPASFVAALLMALPGYLDANLLDRVTGAFLHVDLTHDFKLTRLEIDGAAEAAALARFHDFNRGSSTFGSVVREIEWMYAGSIAVAGRPTPCKLYKFHYVHRARNSKGQTDTDHRYRYGMVVPFHGPDITLIPVPAGSVTEQIREWCRRAPPGLVRHSEFPEFERHYSAYAPDAAAPTRILDPLVRADLEELATVLSMPSLQIGGGELVIACEDEDLLTPKAKASIGIQNPAALEAQIQSIAWPEKLGRLIRTIETLSRHAGR